MQSDGTDARVDDVAVWHDVLPPTDYGSFIVLAVSASTCSQRHV